MAKPIEVPTPDELNKIINGTTFKGDISSNGDFRIDGSLKGSLTSKGKLVVGPTGNIEGEVHCRNAEIFGKVKAKLFVDELLSLRTSADLSGEVVYNKIAIEAGARLVGTLTIKDQAGEVRQQTFTPKDQSGALKEPVSAPAAATLIGKAD